MKLKIHVITCLILSLFLFSVNEAKSQFRFYMFDGEYKGILPCSDYESVFYKLVLKENRIYEETMIFSTNPNDTIFESGKYFSSDNYVILNKKFPGFNRFQHTWEGLKVLDANGNELTGKLGEKYFLWNNNLFSENGEIFEVNTPEMNREKWNKGVLFYGFGNEPFWSVEIINNKSVIFESLNNGKITFPALTSNIIDSITTLYSTESKDEKLEIKIIQNETYDDMSGELFDYEIQLDATFKNSQKPKHLKGWGRYTPDYSLEGNWELTGINDKKIELSQILPGIPGIKFDVDKKIFVGSTGCNKVFGKLNILMGTINLFSIAATLSPCSGNFENEFISFLKNLNTYSVNKDKLTLFTNTGNKLLFVKKDDTQYLLKLKELNNIWILESLNSEKVDKTFYNMDIQTLIIDTKKMSYGGYGGCNSYGGNFFAVDSYINFATITMTLMACPKTKEMEFLEAIQNAISYKIENNKLILSDLKKELIVLKKKE